MDTEILKKLGNEWQRHGKHRIYFDRLFMFYGGEIHRSGLTITGVTVDGEAITLEDARRLEALLRCSKLWYDIAGGQWGYMAAAPEIEPALQKIIDRLTQFATESRNEPANAFPNPHHPDHV